MITLKWSATGSLYLVWLKLIFVEVPPRQQFLAEGDDVCRVIQSPVLVSPEQSGGAAPRLHLIHQKCTPMLLGRDGDQQQYSDCVVNSQGVNAKVKRYRTQLLTQ